MCQDRANGRVTRVIELSLGGSSELKMGERYIAGGTVFRCCGLGQEIHECCNSWRGNAQGLRMLYDITNQSSPGPILEHHNLTLFPQLTPLPPLYHSIISNTHSPPNPIQILCHSLHHHTHASRDGSILLTHKDISLHTIPTTTTLLSTSSSLSPYAQPATPSFHSLSLPPSPN